MNIVWVIRNLSVGGVTRFLENVLREFEQTALAKHITLLSDDERMQSAYPGFRVEVVHASNTLWWDLVAAHRVLKRMHPDVVVYPKGAIPYTDRAMSFRKATIVHDLAYYEPDLHAYKFWDTLYMKEAIRASCRIADRILAVSHATKEDLELRFGVSSERIHVVNEAVDPELLRSSGAVGDDAVVLEKLGVHRPYLYFCGSLSPRKNILRVLQALELLRDRISHQVIVSGGEGWGAAAVRSYARAHLADRFSHVGHVSTEMMRVLYRNADLYVYPSLYEGFGLPILEAQSLGCPVLTSNRTSCPEVAGDTAVIVDPESVEQIAEGIMRVVTDPVFRAQLVKKGLANVKRYSWKRTAAEISYALTTL